MIWVIVGLLMVYPALRILYRKRSTPDYRGKTVWITGASSGLGEYLAYEFSRFGASLILSARNLVQLQRVKSRCSDPVRVQVVAMDMVKYEEVGSVTEGVIRKLQEEGRGIDVLVENAGVSMRCEFKEYSFENHRSMFELNVNAPFYHIQRCVQHMMGRKGSQIVGVTSVAGKLSPAYRSSYSGSKHAFIGILDCLRTELKGYGIGVCNVMPGYVRTNISINALTGGVGERFGATDANIHSAMEPEAFAREAIRGIYCRENQFEVSRGWVATVGMVLRGVCPDLAFRALEWNARSQSRAIAKKE